MTLYFGRPLPTKSSLPGEQSVRIVSPGNPWDAPWIMASYVYILANKYHGTLYVGVTSNLIKRVWEHKESVVPGFTKRYGIKTLVYYEVHEEIEHAIHREKRMKKWSRAMKIRLIEKDNPNWTDLYDTLW